MTFKTWIWQCLFQHQQTPYKTKILRKLPEGNSAVGPPSAFWFGLSHRLESCWWVKSISKVLRLIVNWKNFASSAWNRRRLDLSPLLARSRPNVITYITLTGSNILKEKLKKFFWLKNHKYKSQVLIGKSLAGEASRTSSRKRKDPFWPLS